MAIDYTKRHTPTAAPVSLGKVALTKAAPAISLSKATGASGQMRVNLNWRQDTSRRKGLFGKTVPGIDLDIACLFEMADGSKGMISALGRQFGSLDAPPYVWLDGDDRSGLATEGENLVVNLDHLDRIKRILVVTYIYSGTPNWAEADAVVTLHPVGVAPIEVRLDDASGLTTRSCAIALLTNDNGLLNVRREVFYAASNQDIDRQFGWGMSWAAARKS